MVNTTPKSIQTSNSEQTQPEQSYTFNQADYDAGVQKTTWTEFGFMAQDIDAALPSNYSDARVAFEETDDLHGYDKYIFNGSDLIPVLWKAVQDLKAENDALAARVTALENA